ncbi:succinate dehydrogenase, hydrophobic membrane anchor protein [Hirschia baltica]|uniref:Succinate dehydrogenase hydrophobic membrane anchor subunit n=1 Tax=Hirschia baltica (strain ATCC 49814 / DSM 5838 / IFAM 1418) TaxID=582402 RepID=C6XLU8_HIRBI|nr:succinate dehydrogenase, hydrophobic membrane anchor protein [Hirschia baltica]ACT58004.1 succinate dehydrogenase, hydrophobic membrane anchor protein [Hirschia baltica ATCC 49814]
MSNSMRTPLGKVRGLGSARDGAGHFIGQRVSAVALVFLVPWFLISLLGATRGDNTLERFANAEAWLSQPLNAILVLLAVCGTIYHMRLGLQVVIEDYISGHMPRIVLLMLNTFLSFALIAATVFSVFKVAVA